MSERTIKSPPLHLDDAEDWLTDDCSYDCWVCASALSRYFDMRPLGKSIRLVFSSTRNPDAYQLVPGFQSVCVNIVKVYEMASNEEVYELFYDAVAKVSEVKGFCWLSVEEA